VTDAFDVPASQHFDGIETLSPNIFWAHRLQTVFTDAIGTLMRNIYPISSKPLCSLIDAWDNQILEVNEQAGAHLGKYQFTAVWLWYQNAWLKTNTVAKKLHKISCLYSVLVCIPVHFISTKARSPYEAIGSCNFTISLAHLSTKRHKETKHGTTLCIAQSSFAEP
jgi:hypothetical protein